MTAPMKDEFDINFDHEKLTGAPMEDPWVDANQTDWTKSSPMVDVDEDQVPGDVNPEVQL